MQTFYRDMLGSLLMKKTVLVSGINLVCSNHKSSQAIQQTMACTCRTKKEKRKQKSSLEITENSYSFADTHTHTRIFLNPHASELMKWKKKNKP